jgi:hypothetical protein
MLVAYALSVGNAGTGFRYRTHLITLAVGAMVVLRAHAIRRREAASAPADFGADPAQPVANRPPLAAPV